MKKNEIYYITITNWEKHNGKNKRGHTHFLLSKRFFDDPKIINLPSGGKLLFIGLIGACSDLGSRSIEASYEVLLRFAGGSGQVVDRLMRQLQELQLVTYEKKSVFINRIEKKGKEKNIIDSKESITTVLIESSQRQQKKSLTDSFIPKNPEDLFSGMPADTMARWSALYPDHGFISREVVKAIGWYGINPKKQPRSRRGWILAISSWLERSWRMTQVTTKGSGRPPSRGIEEILNDDQINANQSQFKLVSVGEK